MFDYGAAPSTLGWKARIAVWLLQRRLKAIGEPINSSFTRPEILGLLRDAGFGETEDLNHTDLNQRYLANRTDGLRVGEAMHLAKATVTRP